MAEDEQRTHRGRRLLGELAGFASGLARTPTLALDWRTLPRGDGPVLVLPGFATTDASTVVIRGVLERLGYATYGWGLGRNHGNHVKLLPRVVERITRLASEHDEASFPVEALVVEELGSDAFLYGNLIGDDLRAAVQYMVDASK